MPLRKGETALGAATALGTAAATGGDFIFGWLAWDSPKYERVPDEVVEQIITDFMTDEAQFNAEVSLWMQVAAGNVPPIEELEAMAEAEERRKDDDSVQAEIHAVSAAGKANPERLGWLAWLCFAFFMLAGVLILLGAVAV